MDDSNQETTTLGAGCFWCVEAIFNDLKGVTEVASGYSGGKNENPTYQEVCSGSTGHAEVIQITFDSQEISFKEILSVFFAVHDPTTLNQQGNDIGTQYRSAVFYHSDEQKQLAENLIKEIEEMKLWDNPIITEITEFEKLYIAENYHNDYFANNPDQPYCIAVVAPKVAKLERLLWIN